jgi:transmembrane sensor
LQELFADDAYEEVLKQLLEKSYQDIRSGHANDPVDLEKKEKIFNDIIKRYPVSLKQHLRRRMIWSVAAAAVILIAVVVLYFPAQRLKRMMHPNAVAGGDLQPGANKAYLTLSNGQRVSLTDAASGVIAQQAGTIINKGTGAQLVYEVPQKQDSGAGNLINTIETSIGGQFQVRLPDGTQVWLNAATRLKYPVVFERPQRRVELSG